MKAGGKLLSYLLLPEQLCQQRYDINNQDNNNLKQALKENRSAGVGSCTLQSPANTLICSPASGGMQEAWPRGWFTSNQQGYTRLRTHLAEKLGLPLEAKEPSPTRKWVLSEGLCAEHMGDCWCLGISNRQKSRVFLWEALICSFHRTCLISSHTWACCPSGPAVP